MECFIFPAECKSDSECPFDKACINENCLDPCRNGGTAQCGRGAECTIQSHHAQCTCPAGTQGNPLISCISVKCQYNEDCADHEACDRLNRVCRPVCDDDTCADSATCLGREHQAKCVCPPGMNGNPYVECSRSQQPVEADKPECDVDADCPSMNACINSRCQNPCTIANVCTLDQECRVLNTLPLRTVICQCPVDTVIDQNGRCKQIIQVTSQCVTDSNCPETDKCIRGSCIEACKVDICGVNAQCTPRGHRGLCTCAPGYVGNPHVECTNSKFHDY